ncbi:MAG: helix-turn-helix transcriptional regulator [Planctomycetaceae bacterium]
MSQTTHDSLELQLCKRLEATRLNQNVSQASLASEAGVSRRTISRMENGEGVSLNTFIRVARALGLTDELLALFVVPDISPIDRVRERPPRKHASSPRKKPAQPTPWEWDD